MNSSYSQIGDNRPSGYIQYNNQPSQNTVLSHTIAENHVNFSDAASIDMMLCPLTQQFMKDPVRIICGHTFDREHLVQANILNEKKICPICKSEYNSFIPDLFVKNVIIKHCEEEKKRQHREIHGQITEMSLQTYNLLIDASKQLEKIHNGCNDLKDSLQQLNSHTRQNGSQQQKTEIKTRNTQNPNTRSNIDVVKPKPSLQHPSQQQWNAQQSQVNQQQFFQTTNSIERRETVQPNFSALTMANNTLQAPSCKRTNDHIISNNYYNNLNEDEVVLKRPKVGIEANRSNINSNIQFNPLDNGNIQFNLFDNNDNQYDINEYNNPDNTSINFNNNGEFLNYTKATDVFAWNQASDPFGFSETEETNLVDTFDVSYHKG